MQPEPVGGMMQEGDWVFIKTVLDRSGRIFRASLRDARKLGGLRGEISANAVRNSENPTEHLAAKYN